MTYPESGRSFMTDPGLLGNSKMVVIIYTNIINMT